MILALYPKWFIYNTDVMNKTEGSKVQKGMLSDTYKDIHSDLKELHVIKMDDIFIDTVCK